MGREFRFKLIVQNPYVFILCLLGGVNEGVFNFGYIFGKETLRDMPPQYYQYVVSIGGMIGPILFGALADKKGIFFMTIFLSAILILANFSFVAFVLTHVQHPIFYYVTAFVESAMAMSLVTLGVALVGERLKLKGIFRAFTLSNLFFGLGIIIASRIVQLTTPSFLAFKFCTGSINVILVGLLIYYYVQD